MSEILTKRAGLAGWITLNRPGALNAMTHQMCSEIEAALDAFEADDAVTVICLDSMGDKAFCAGGDIADLYRTGAAGDFDYGRAFWTDEYRLNAKLATSPKPIVSFLQGHTLGGGVGIGCHVPHRIVCETSKIAMPEVQIGIVPDVGGSLLLGRAPGRMGEYLGLTAARMGPADAIYAGFADVFVPYENWSQLKEDISRTGTPAAIDALASTPPTGKLAQMQSFADAHFGGDSLTDIVNALEQSEHEAAAVALDQLKPNSPLAMACAVEVIHRNRRAGDIVAALQLEYRFTFRAASDGEFVEGIRAMIIDKDKAPNWQHDLKSVPGVSVANMLKPLGANALDLTEKTP